MYEQYTDKQIVEMLVPKLSKILGNGMWESALEHSEGGRNLIRIIATIYRSAYIRGQLGRSFIIGRPKQTERWVPATKENVQVGSKVRITDGKSHKDNPQWFPDVGTVGIVKEAGFHTCFIQWPEGSTSGKDEWYCDDTRLEVLLCE